jgi:hypothetical protein
MMAAIFAALTLALLFAWSGRTRLATAAIAACLVLAIGEFLWEIYNPNYGFRMPWIQVEAVPGQLGGV